MEHVPPKCLFPELKDTADGLNRRVDLIRVPACSEHNTRKSSDDELFFFVVATQVLANATATQQVRTKISRAIERSPGLALRLLGDATQAEVVEHLTGRQLDAVAVPLEYERFERVVELIARAMHFKCFGEKWTADFPLHVDFISKPGRSGEELAEAMRFDAARVEMHSMFEDAFAGIPLQGSNPDVFAYQVIDRPDEDTRILRMRFYETGRATAFFGQGARLHRHPSG